MDLKLPQEILEAPTLEDAARLFGILLELDTAAPVAATQRAINDPRYARALIGTRKLPHIRNKLLSETKPTTPQLIRKASESVLKWGMEGMKPATPWVIERRLAACNACDHQVPAPETLIYRGAKVAVGKDAKICEACDCLTNTKAAIETERCPVRDPDNPELSKWGEHWVSPKDHPKGPW